VAVLLGVDVQQVQAWEASDADIPGGFLVELAAMGFDAGYLARDQPTVLPAGARLPDERLLRYCWRGLGREVKAALRCRFAGVK